MKGINRGNQLFSLCGLNCGLCPMHIDRWCPGCGGGDGNQSCAIARCSLQHEAIEYCSDCPEYPCARYDGIDEFDSFITHQHQKKDLQRAKEMDIAAYNGEQREKIKILHYFLENFNDGRRKTFFCVAVNLLDLRDIEAVKERLMGGPMLDGLSLKEKAALAVSLLQDIADKQGILLKIRKKARKK